MNKSNQINHYVLGFAFDSAQAHKVVLINKCRPTWQRGKLNGLGGRVELGETAEQAMSREFKEECGIHIYAGLWEQFATMRAPGLGVVVDVFRVFGFDGEIQTCTDEPVLLRDPRVITNVMLPNLRWLLPLAIQASGETIFQFEIEPHGDMT